MKERLNSLQSDLDRKKRRAKAQRKWRKGKRKQQKQIRDKLVELGAVDDLDDDLKIHGHVGRPRIETTRSGSLLASSTIYNRTS